MNFISINHVEGILILSDVCSKCIYQLICIFRLVKIFHILNFVTYFLTFNIYLSVSHSVPKLSTLSYFCRYF